LCGAALFLTSREYRSSLSASGALSDVIHFNLQLVEDVSSHWERSPYWSLEFVTADKEYNVNEVGAPSLLACINVSATTL
jgi:hypothetical protein